MHLIYYLSVLPILPFLVHSAIPIDVLQSETTISHPIYNIPKNGLNATLSSFKDYTMIILLTTLSDKYNCELCKQFDPIYTEMATDIITTYPQVQGNVFFMRLDAVDHIDDLKALSVKNVPQVWIFPDSLRVYGKEKMKDLKNKLLNGEDIGDINVGMEHYVFDFVQGESVGEMLIRFGDFVGSVIGVNVNDAISKKTDNGIDWFVSLQWFIYIFIGIKVLQKIREQDNEENVIPLWRDKNVYMFLSLILIYVNLSGLNFCLQRHVPFIAQNEGKILWVATGSRTQLGMESIITITFQICFSLLFIILIDGVKYFSDGNGDLMVLIGAIVMLLLINFFNNIYSIKDGGYPFKFINFF